MGLVKWIGFVGVCGVIGSPVRDGHGAEGPLGTATLLVGALTPETMFLTQLGERGARLRELVGLTSLAFLVMVLGYLLLQAQAPGVFPTFYA